jgi:hypothetical protein
MFGGMTPAAALEHVQKMRQNPRNFFDWDNSAARMNLYDGDDGPELTLDGHFTRKDLLALITLWPEDTP